MLECESELRMLDPGAHLEKDMHSVGRDLHQVALRTSTKYEVIIQPSSCSI